MSDFTEGILEKRRKQAEEFSELARTARIVAAINKQTAVVKQQNEKLDTIIELLRKDQQTDKDAKQT